MIFNFDCFITSRKNLNNRKKERKITATKNAGKKNLALRLRDRSLNKQQEEEEVAEKKYNISVKPMRMTQCDAMHNNNTNEKKKHRARNVVCN